MRHVTIAALLAAMLVGGAAAAVAAPPADGCPRGWTLWDVDTEPYMADNAVDEDGNNNGSVCARARGNQTFGDGHQIYSFADDTFFPAR